MIVSRSSFAPIVISLCDTGIYAVDTETTGLRPYLGDELFSIIIATESTSYYFNFKTYPGLDQEWTLPREWIPLLDQIFRNEASLFFLANAKFDLAMLAREGLFIHGTVHCTEAAARLLYNQHMKYSLAECAARIGEAKSTAVDEYITKNKLYTEHTLETGKKVKQPHYDRVPFTIISSYGMKDGEITYKLGKHQLGELEKIHASTASIYPSIKQVYENELTLTKVCFDIERTGILVDKAYCEQAYSFEMNRAVKAKMKFEVLSGSPFIDSWKALAKAFDNAGERYPMTAPTKTRPKGTPSFNEEVLTGFKSPLAELVLEYRDATKRANSYYANFLKYADGNGRVHCNIRQAGTDTGRFSITDPALQTLNKEEDDKGEYSVRRAFVPTPDFVFLMVDFDQQEFRLMLDYAGEKEVIRRILADGLDVHAATALQMGVGRPTAKALNFLLIYGGGPGLLAKKLGISPPDAKNLRDQYFSSLPKVSVWIRRVIAKAKNEGVVTNWYGRKYYFPYVNAEVGNRSYVAPNHIIQGGTAEVMRLAMVRLNEFLRGKKTRIVLTIHDEIIFEIHKSELDLAPELVKIMETTYPHRYIPLTCTASYSWKSWADKTKGYPV